MRKRRSIRQEAKARDLARGTHRLLAVNTAPFHREREVLLARKANAVRAGLVGTRVRGEDRLLLVCRELCGGSYQIAERWRRAEHTLKFADCAQIPPCRPMMAACAILPVPRRLESIYANHRTEF